MDPRDFMVHIQGRDAYLIVLLIVIAVLWWFQNHALAELEQFMNEHPELRQRFRLWQASRVRCFLHNRLDCSVCGEKRD